MGGASVLPSSEAGLYDFLYNPFPGIHCGTLDHPGVNGLCGAAALSCGCRHDDGRHIVAQAATEREGFKRLGTWTRGVDTELFTPENASELDLPRPIFMTVGRVAVEKNLEAFLSLNLPGSKVVVGDGPQKSLLESRYPKVRFLGEKTGRELSAHLTAADVFVFPSLTDTFGIVQLEALACGTPVAAFPVTGPLDVIADHPVGALDTDLRSACIRALGISRETCRNFALQRSWENSARQFIGNLSALQPSRLLRPASRLAAQRAMQG